VDTDNIIKTIMAKPWSNTYCLLKAIGASGEQVDEAWRDYRRKYMRSQRWQDIRTKALERSGRTCEQCGRRQEDGYKLDVHHITYIRLGGELMEDVQVLCYLCHGQLHYRRRVRQDETE
jgi:5-methylcytosine-specific restriction endonuclease McrA